MLKLKKNVVDLIKANVKPEFVDHHIEMLIENPPSPTWSSRLWFDSCHTIHGKTIYFNLTKDDFEEVEDLKPYKWYPREKWNGNPERYWVLERTVDLDSPLNDMPQRIDCIRSLTTHFMYIEPLEYEDED